MSLVTRGKDADIFEQFTGLDFEMVIRNHYHEVLTFSEKLMIYIIRALQTREQYQRLTKVVEQVFPGAENFKLPPGDDAVRITFAEGVKMLKEAGVEADEMEDLRYDSKSCSAVTLCSLPCRSILHLPVPSSSVKAIRISLFGSVSCSAI